jgi:hypothetical protein
MVIAIMQAIDNQDDKAYFGKKYHDIGIMCCAENE